MAMQWPIEGHWTFLFFLFLGKKHQTHLWHFYEHTSWKRFRSIGKRIFYESNEVTFNGVNDTGILTSGTYGWNRVFCGENIVEVSEKQRFFFRFAFPMSYWSEYSQNWKSHQSLAFAYSDLAARHWTRIVCRLETKRIENIRIRKLATSTAADK